MRGHLERTHLEQPEAPARRIGRVQLVDAELRAMRIAGHVDQEIAQQPVDEPRRHGGARLGELLERDLELVERIVARLVEARRLRRRTQEQAREQIRQRRMVVPVREQAAQEIRPPQERRILRRRAAEHEVVAAAGADVTAVNHEFLGAQLTAACCVVEERGCFDELVPARARLHVDLDDPGIGRYLEIDQARIRRRLVAFNDDGLAERPGARFHRCDELEVILEGARRRHEHVEHAAALLGAHRGAYGRGGLRLEQSCTWHTSEPLPVASSAPAPAASCAPVPIASGEAASAASNAAAASDAAARVVGQRPYAPVRAPARAAAAPRNPAWDRRIDKRVVRRPHPGQRIERQAIADRRIARDEIAASRRAGTTDRSATPTARAGGRSGARSPQARRACRRARARGAPARSGRRVSPSADRH